MRAILFRNSIVVLILGLLINTSGFAQEIDVSDYKMLFNFKTVKQHDNSRLLEVSFIARNKKNRKDKIPVYDAKIKFYNTLNDNEQLLGTSKTSKEGLAQITLPEDHNYLTDEGRNINLKASFEGTDALDEEEEEISLKDLFLELDLTEIDSIKTVVVNAFAIDSSGSRAPVKEADIIISVGGMLSNMKIEEGSIEDGTFQFEMPTDIPGDVNGDITVYSIIEDSEEFGNVIQKESVNWGVLDKEYKEESNTLWSEAAPIWMYIVLTILLVGVWANFAYTIINLFKIKKEGKKLKLETEN